MDFYAFPADGVSVCGDTERARECIRVKGHSGPHMTCVPKEGSAMWGGEASDLEVRSQGLEVENRAMKDQVGHMAQRISDLTEELMAAETGPSFLATSLQEAQATLSKIEDELRETSGQRDDALAKLRSKEASAENWRLRASEILTWFCEDNELGEIE